MAATGSWADLNRDLLVSIADAGGCLSIGEYARLRGVCTAWRSALAPPFPVLLGLDHDSGRRAPVRASVFSLPARRSFCPFMASSALDNSLDEDDRGYAMPVQFVVQPFISHASIVGSGSGRLAVAVHRQMTTRGSSLSQLDYTAWFSLFHRRTGEEAKLDPPSRAHDECVRKVVFAPNRPHGGPKDWPTAVALYGRKKVAYIDRSKRWTTVHIPRWAEHLVDLALDAGGGNVYCLDVRGGVHVRRIPHGGQKKQETAVVVEPPLLAPPPIHVSDAYAPPYDVATVRNRAKHLFFCHGSLHQVWQTNRDEIFVLRFDPGRRPCWDAAKDLGGFSVFIGENSNPAVLRAGAGTRADCVYWIINGVQGVPSRVMVYDMATGTSELCCTNKGHCWFFDDDNVVTISVDNTKKQKRKGCSR